MYLDTTFEDRLTEYWANAYQDNPKLRDVVEDEEFDMQAIQDQWAAEAESGNVNIDNVNDWEDVNNGD